jgi:DNA-directed RNA polymerase specialized sigma24 family protein
VNAVNKKKPWSMRTHRQGTMKDKEVSIMSITNSTSPVAQVDETLFSEMLRNARYDIVSFAQSSGLDRDDLAQEVAMKIIRRWETIITRESPLPYARRVARNTLIDEYNRVAKRRRLAPLVSMQSLEEQGVQFSFNPDQDAFSYEQFDEEVQL